MKLEKEVNILPVVTCDETKDACKNITIYVNIPELNKDEMKIIRKGQVSKIKMTLEYQEPILDEEERKYLSSVIRPFKDRVKDIIKRKSLYDENEEYIVIYVNEAGILMFPHFEEGSKYKNMELNKEYTLEELGL